MKERPRRIFGIILGLAIGLVYGLVSQLINPLLLPGIPLYQPFPGRFAVIVLIILGGGLMGGLVAWPSEPISGVLISAFVGSSLTFLESMLRTTWGASQTPATIILLLITFLPRTVLFLPIAGVIRWVIHIWENELVNIEFSVGKLAFSIIVLVAITVWVGSFSVYPKDARYALQKTDQLIALGMNANTVDRIPSSLRSVDGFMEGAQGPFTLELSTNPDLLPVQRPIAGYGVTEYAVFVVFKNGFHFGCAFTPPNPLPSCGGF
jgi:hypothetical protein